METRNYEDVAASDDPVEFVQQRGSMWTAKCAYCDTAATMTTEQEARWEISRHAKNVLEGNHWSHIQQLFVNVNEREKERAHHARYKAIMGDAETAMQMNKEGL